MAQITETFNNALSEIGLRYYGNNFTNVRNGSATLAFGAPYNIQNISAGGIDTSWDTANYSIDRLWFHFNTSTIPDNATIVSAFLRLPGTSTSFSNVNTLTAHIVASTVVSDTTLGTDGAQWGNVGTTSFGSKTFASWNQSADNDISLNATGLAALSLSAYSKLAIRTSRDIDNSAPTGFNYCTFSGGGVLSVTYTVPDEGGYFFLSS